MLTELQTATQQQNKARGNTEEDVVEERSEQQQQQQQHLDGMDNKVGKLHAPNFACCMERGKGFCKIFRKYICTHIRQDLGDF